MSNNELLLQFTSAPDDSFVKIDTVQAIWGGIAKSTVWRWRRNSIIPDPVNITRTGTKLWRVGDLREALKNMGGQK